MQNQEGEEDEPSVVFAAVVEDVLVRKIIFNMILLCSLRVNKNTLGTMVGQAAATERRP